METPYSIYVHIPFCKARCGYCAFSSNTDFFLQQAYFDKLFAEIAACDKPQKVVSTLFLGGGTPTAVEDIFLVQLFDVLKQNFVFADDCEITCECNPDSATKEKLQLLFDLGVNRLSFGLQSANDATLAKIGRLHTYNQFISALDNALTIGFDNVSADLIVGLPESKQEFLHTMDVVTQLPLSHLSLYALELYPDTPLWQQRNTCPTDSDYLAELYDQSVSFMVSKGFVRYETSNFARGGQRCRHNLNYWTEGRYYGFGAAASGFVGDVRYSNAWAIADYLEKDVGDLRVEQETESLFEQAKEYAMLALRLSDGVDVDLFAERYGKDFWQFFENATKLQQQGFLAEQNGCVVIPDSKVYVANSILAELLDC